MEKLYVNFAKPRTLKEFFTKFFDEEDNFYYSDRVVSGKETYYDQECTNLQCSAGRNRSFSDLLNLAKTYYKSATHKKVLITLINLKLINRNKEPCYFYLLYCGDVEKNVIIYFFRKNVSEVHDNITSDGYSQASILEPIGVISNHSEIYESKYYKIN